MDIVRTGGTVVVVARHTDRPDFSPVNHPYFERDIPLVTSYGYSPAGGRWDRDASLSLTLDLISQGKLVIGPMINSEFQWSELPEVYGHLDRGDSSLLGIVIRWPE